MGGFQVRLVRRRGLRQQFHLRIESAAPPFETLFSSEKYRHRSYAEALGRTIAEHLGATFIDDTREG